MEPHRRRSSALGAKLDTRHQGDAQRGYCLDALDHVPAGAMQASGTEAGRAWPRAQWCERGTSLEEVAAREALANALVDEILAEEAAKGPKSSGKT